MSHLCHGKFAAAQLLFKDATAVYNHISRQYFKTLGMSRQIFLWRCDALRRPVVAAKI